MILRISAFSQSAVVVAAPERQNTQRLSTIRIPRQQQRLGKNRIRQNLQHLRADPTVKLRLASTVLLDACNFSYLHCDFWWR
mmetsp:Transcript_136944/g.242002  ORF Transcript_136944/g.242002 Transcript_136944/m.242002 type:complete len:82 (-) Transcript_136944:28-273(-)